MKKIGVGEYECHNGELVQIRFFCTPSRENVNIRRSLDGVNLITVNTNSIQFQMGSSQINLSLQFAFILTGSCLNQVLVVNKSPTKDDRIMSGANGGGTDFLTLNFIPV